MEIPDLDYHLASFSSPDHRFQHAVIDRIGPKLTRATFDNYSTEYKKQSAVWKAIKKYAEDSDDAMQNGQNLCLCGTRGTGKDHLAMAAAKRFHKAGKSVQWQNGTSLLSEHSQCWSGGPTEEQLVTKYFQCDVLWISDLVHVGSKFTDAQMRYITSLFDKRIRFGKLIWLTINFTSFDKLSVAIGSAAADRATCNALRVHFDWPSYRQNRTTDVNQETD